MAIDTVSGNKKSDSQQGLLQMLYPKYRLYNDEYFGGKLPHIPIMLRNECVVDGREAWGRFDCKATYSKITRRIIDVKNWGTITLLTKYNVPVEHYLQTLLHEMIHAYIILVLKRYPKDPHGELFMEMADTISAQEGFDIQPENEMVSYSDMDNQDVVDNDNVDVHDNGYGDITANADTANTGKPQILFLVKINNENAPFKYWVARCPNRNLVALYKTRFQNAFEKSKPYISFRECNVPGFSKLPDDVNKLYGFGANTPQELCGKLSKYCGTSPEEFYRFFGVAGEQRNNND